MAGSHIPYENATSGAAARDEADALLREVVPVLEAVQRSIQPRYVKGFVPANGVSEDGPLIERIRHYLAMLAAPAPASDEAVPTGWTPRRISHLLEDCATYYRVLYARHRIPPGYQGIDPAKLEQAAQAVNALVAPASGGVDAGEVKRIRDWLLERNREHLAESQNRNWLIRRHAGDAEMFLDAAILLSSLAALAKPASSPAGGVVVEALRPFADVADHFDNYDEEPGNHSVLCTVRLVDLRRARDIFRGAALSQSTSAGRVGE